MKEYDCWNILKTQQQKLRNENHYIHKGVKSMKKEWQNVVILYQYKLAMVCFGHQLSFCFVLTSFFDGFALFHHYFVEFFKFSMKVSLFQLGSLTHL